MDSKLVFGVVALLALVGSAAADWTEYHDPVMGIVGFPPNWITVVPGGHIYGYGITVVCHLPGKVETITSPSGPYDPSPAKVVDVPIVAGS